MTDPRFYTPQGPFPLSYLAKISNSKLGTGSDPDRLFANVAPLSKAGQDDVTFMDNRKYLHELKTSHAGAVIIHSDLEASAPMGIGLIFNPKPYKAYALIAQAFHPIRTNQVSDISPNAVIALDATIGAGCVIEAGVIIGSQVKIGDNVKIGPNVTIGNAVEIESETIIGANVTISHCLIGKRVRILPGARIGQEGFGFAMDPQGHIRIPQLGRVLIGDDVEIGANTTIDRGSGPDTVIGNGCMIDNLVQIAHNVVLEPGCVIVAQAGIAGSAHLETGVAVGGQTGIIGHIKIGRGAKIAGNSGVMRDVEPGVTMMGYPAVTSRRFFRQIALLDKLSSMKKDSGKKD